jgi:peptidoglycan glycosyltransferase
MGEDVVLSLDLSVQQLADRLLGDYQGSIVVLDIQSGEILAMVSHPAYDATRLDDDWDSLISAPNTPLLNRATQGLYPVGDLARWIGLIGLLSSGGTVPDDPLNADVDEMLAPLSPGGYVATAHQLGFDTSPSPDLPGSVGLLPDFEGKGTVRDLAVTPLHMARLMVAVVAGGEMPVARLAPESGTDYRETVFSGPVSTKLINWIPVYGDTAGWTGVALPVETGTQPISWFVGYGPRQDPAVAIAIVVEESGAGRGLTLSMARQIVDSFE